MKIRFGFLALLPLLAACNDNPSSDNCEVTSVVISGAPASMLAGTNTTATATVTQTGCGDLTVTWGTSNATVLNVNQSGQLSALTAGGPVTITATTGGKQGTAQVTVTANPVASVVVSPDSIVLGTGQSFMLDAVTRAANDAILTGRTVVWGTSLGASATVTNGLVAGVAPGDVTISATSETVIGNAKVFVAAPKVGFFWMGNPNPVGTETPNSIYSYANGTSTFFASLGSTGVYSTEINGVSRTGVETEIWFTTAYDDAPNRYCNIGGWGPETATVLCWNGVGAPTNLSFNILKLGSATMGGRFAYAWANDATPTEPYQPNAYYRFSSSNQPITVTKTATGVYTVLFAGQGRKVASDREALMVVAYGSGNTDCHSGGWTTVGTDLSATVYCFNGTGSATDSRFNIALVSTARAGGLFGLVDADQPSNAVTHTPSNSVSPTGSVEVSRQSAGVYDVSFIGMIRAGGLKETYQVSVIGNTTNRCSIGYWTATGVGSTVRIRCGNIAGVPTDTRFSVVALN